MTRYTIYDHDLDKLVTDKTYSTAEEAADDIDQRMNNCMVVAVNVENDEDEDAR